MIVAALSDFSAAFCLFVAGHGGCLLVGKVCFGVGGPSPGNREQGVLGGVFGGEV